MSVPCDTPPPVLHIVSDLLSNPWSTLRSKSAPAPPVALSMLHNYQGLAIKVSGPQPTVIKKPEIVSAFDGTVNSTIPYSSSLLLQPNSQHRNKKQTLSCSRYGGVFDPYDIAASVCFIVIAKVAAQTEQTNMSFNPVNFTLRSFRPVESEMVSECELLEISRIRSWDIHHSFSGEGLRILRARKARMLRKGTKLI
jgi:hypothetical protein